jgi:diguanylate cyclase (GGDEF)-like protein
MHATREKAQDSRRAAGVVASRRLSAWLGGVTAFLVVLGVIASTFGAGAVARENVAASRQGLLSSSTAITATLQLAILHEQDLVSSASGFIALDPEATSQQFFNWLTSVNAVMQYPELLGIVYSVIVPAAELPAFAARQVANPVGPLAPNGTFQVLPPGKRSYYCLMQVGLALYDDAALPAGEDMCSPGPKRTVAMSTLDSGDSAYLPLNYGVGVTYLSVDAPVYQGGSAPSTVAGRRAAFLGWVEMAVVPQIVLTEALQGHPHTAVVLAYHAGSSETKFRSGMAPSGAASETVNLRAGWTVTVLASVAAGGILKNGGALALLLAGIVLSLLIGSLVFVLGTGRARALRVVHEQTGTLRHQAMHDALTDLPNRALIMDRIEQLLARGRRQGTVSAALFVDLDEFKNVNDTLGHAVGDKLLIAVSNRLQGTLRDADTIGRMGGDEFVVLIDGASIDAAPELVASRLLEVMRQPFVIDGVTTPLMMSASVGIAIGDRSMPGDLLRDADVALYQAKAAGRNRYEIFNQEMHTETQQRLELEFDLRSALATEQFRLMYQPIYNLDDLAIVGVEALLRWDHPTRGTVQPDDFIPILEQTGQIREVGRWVLGQACSQMAVWHGRGDTLDVSVNLSARQLEDAAIVEYISDALCQSGLDAGSLIIEITETALMHHADTTVLRLEAVKALGVRVAVDNFGTGYSSLAYLQQFPVDCIKIDRSFTGAITSSPESKALIATLVQLGKDLGLKTLAEGVETTGQMDHLRGELVNQAQGFLFARPLEPDALEARLLAPMRSGAEQAGGSCSDSPGVGVT